MVEVELQNALQFTFLSSLNPPPGRWGAHEAPLLISVLISVNTWMWHHQPSIKPLLVPDTRADLCALAHSQPLCLYHTTTSLWQTGLSSPAATLHAASKRTAVEKRPPGPTEDGLMNQTCARSFLLITEVSSGINTPWLEGTTYCDLPQFPWTEGQSPQEPVQWERPPSNKVTSHYVHIARKGETQEDRDESEQKEWGMRDQKGKEGEGKESKIPGAGCNA